MSIIDEWAPRLPSIAHATSVLYTAAGASALFITIINFVLLNPHPYFWNISQHLVTSFVMLVEMSQVMLIVQWQLYVYPLSWAYLYTLFTWIVVGCGEKVWPYNFMKARTLWSLVWYNGILIVSVFTFALWLWLDRSKRNVVAGKREKLLLQGQRQRQGQGLNCNWCKCCWGATGSSVGADRGTGTATVVGDGRPDAEAAPEEVSPASVTTPSSSAPFSADAGDVESGNSVIVLASGGDAAAVSANV